jgi:hypothetical protein
MFEHLKRDLEPLHHDNVFLPVPSEEIEAAEMSLGYSFPPQLRRFFEEVGYGFVAMGTEDAKRDTNLCNRIVPPKGIISLLFDPNYYWRPSEGFRPGRMPFFDTGDWTYLVMLPQSGKPDAVYWNDGTNQIADDLVEFLDRLHKHAGFYVPPDDGT